MSLQSLLETGAIGAEDFAAAVNAASADGRGQIIGEDGQGGDSIEKKIGLSFGLKNGSRFRFDLETCLNYPFLTIFLV